MKKKGFTLIELLAVIVILAIIALIATPIVMNVIENSKKGAAERSAENYLKAVETAVVEAKMNEGYILEGEYTIQEDGNLCKTGTQCTDETEIKINMSGNKPTEGSVIIQDGIVVTNSTALKVGNYFVSYDENGKIFSTKEDIVNNSVTVYRNSHDQIAIGQEIDLSNTTIFKKNPSELGDSYLKHVVKNNIVTESYACSVFNSTEVCLKGGSEDYENYLDNTFILKEVRDKGFDCVLGEDGADCLNGDDLYTSTALRAWPAPNYTVSAINGDTNRCDVYNDGISLCEGTPSTIVTVYRNSSDLIEKSQEIDLSNTETFKTNSSELGDSYLKHVVKNNVVIESYACMKYNDTEEVCLRGGINGYERYLDNISILRGIKDKLYECIFGEGAAVCSNGDIYYLGTVDLLASPEGNVLVDQYNGKRCDVYTDGSSRCEGQGNITEYSTVLDLFNTNETNISDFIKNQSETTPTLTYNPITGEKGCQQDNTSCFGWYVLEDKGKDYGRISLIMDRNLVDNIAWLNANDKNNNDGKIEPITAMNYLKSLTSDWIHKVTLPTAQQIANIENDISWTPAHKTSESFPNDLLNAAWLASNISTEETGYWTSTHVTPETQPFAWSVKYKKMNNTKSGYLSSTTRRNLETINGIRPVITIPKSYLQ